MTLLMDQRPVWTRAEDAVAAAEFDLRTGIDVVRCDCGATLRVHSDAGAFSCVGCGFLFDLHPSATWGEWERGVSPGCMRVPPAVPKDADALDGSPGSELSSSGSSSGGLGAPLPEIPSTDGWS